MAARRAIGIDFGTTNTVVSVLEADGRARVLPVASDDGPLEAFRSTLSFHADPDEASRRIVEAGPFAIAAWLDEPLETRLIQSFKSYAASPLFQETRILGRRWAFEDLLSTFLLKLRAHAGEAFAIEGATAVVGRPVTFAGRQAEESLAMERYARAFARLGFAEVRYAFEPVAAAVAYAQKLAGDATILVGDFGGGTSDFSVVRFRRAGGRIAAEPLASAGVPLAGDAFDYRIIDHLVSPALGKGSSYAALGPVLPVPNRWYAAFARWEQLALLRASADMRDIRAMRRTALEPEKIAALVEVIDGNHGWRLYQAVSRCKEALSHSAAAPFSFVAGEVAIEAEVRRADFEAWIAPELAAMAAGVETALERAGLSAGAIDQVFLTGGSSFVPAVRGLFHDRFGADRVEGGGELVSIATGLAHLAGEAAGADLVSELART